MKEVEVPVYIEFSWYDFQNDEKKLLDYVLNKTLPNFYGTNKLNNFTLGYINTKVSFLKGTTTIPNQKLYIEKLEPFLNKGDFASDYKELLKKAN